jgi:hypothetical protein
LRIQFHILSPYKDYAITCVRKIVKWYFSLVTNCKSDACRGSCEHQRATMRLNKNAVRSGEYLVSPLVKAWWHQQMHNTQAMRLRDTKGQA